MFALADVMEFRSENRERAEANRRQALALLDAERKFWHGKLRKAATEAEVKDAREQLDMLDELEAQHV
jgi:hypothetical protein